ncbi:MAG: amidohydrolase family protein [Candidatus Lokiarchaeota archaeon]|nr:amidohydrolase family protein [Candidatus Lokiarchaeota archaeon]
MRDGNYIFDAHMHYTGIFKPPDMSFIDYLDANGIDRAIINTLNTKANMSVLKDKMGQLLKLGKTNLQKFNIFSEFSENGQPDHQKVIELQKSNPERIFPFFWYNPTDPKDEDQKKGLKILEDALNNEFYGVKLQLAMIPVAVERLYPVAELLTKYDKPLYIHPSGGVFAAPRTSPFSLIPLVRENPDLKLIIGHASYTMEFVIEVVAAVKSLGTLAKNIFFETSVSIPFGIASYAKIFGADHVLFGSDTPPASPWTPEYDKIALMNLPTSQKKLIFNDNTARLLKVTK